MLAQQVKDTHERLGRRGVLHELVRITQEIDLDLIRDGMDLQDAVRQDRNHVATAHLIMDQVDRGLDHAFRAIGDHHRLQAARVIRIKFQDL